MRRTRWSVILAVVSLLVIVSVLTGLSGCAPAPTPTPTITPTPTREPLLPGAPGQTLAPRLQTAVPEVQTAVPQRPTAAPTP